MKLMKCAKGHFYDGDIYPECPHCKATASNNITEKKVHSKLFFNGADKKSDSADYWEPADNNNNAPVSTSNESSEQQGAPTLDLKREIESLNHTVKLTNGGQRESTNSGTVHVTGSVDKEVKTMAISSNQVTAKAPVVGWLVGLNGEVYGESFQLVSGKNFIGRGADMDVVLHGDFSVSRNKHAIIVYDPKGKQFFLQPGESKELFYMNDDVVLDIKKMQHGDLLQIGETKLKFIALCGEDFTWENNA